MADPEILYPALSLASRLELLAGKDLGLAATLAAALDHITFDLHGPGANAAAHRLMDALWPVDDPPADWWRSPVGILVARAIGYHRDVAPAIAVGAILNVTRQRIYGLVDEGKLIQREHGICTASLREHLQVYGRRP